MTRWASDQDWGENQGQRREVEATGNTEQQKGNWSDIQAYTQRATQTLSLSVLIIKRGK